ncbi:MAG: protein translocase subunit SecD, partial [Bacteroidia bacterium]|nr:protein translocase subunit SecD [Bacteroidia bacterium]
RILIQLPGVKDAERVRKLLRGTANLEFWPTYTLEQFFPFLQKINEKVKQQQTAQKAAEGEDKKQTAENTKQTQADKDKGETADAQKPQADGKAAGDSAKTDSAVAQSKSDTLDSAAVAKMSDEEKRELFKKENPFFALCDFRIAGNPQNNQPMMGYTLVSDTAKVNRILNDPEIRRILPSDVLFFWSAKPLSEEAQYFTLYAVKGNRERRAPLSGSTIVDAREDKDQFKQNVVSMTMNTEGARIWKKMTQENLGKSIAVVLDDLVYTAPTVQSVITNGSSQITGSFTIEEAKDLANILKAGKLDAPARIEGEEVVGPTLGAETVRRGFISFLAGFAGVILFMLLYYRKAGVIAAVALIFNLIFIVGVASALNVVLNLPGIAGIVLTMGMAVDANVLIYERIREELESGKSQKGSIAAGFNGAFSAILDGNITTFLTGAILYLFGSGLIRGFAVMLMIGIATTLITGLLVTRLILDYMTSKREAKIDFGSRAAVAFFKRANFPFVERRKIGFVIAGTIAAVFLLLIASAGFKFGVDFLGGRQYIVEFASAPDVDRLRAELSKTFQSEPQIKTVGGGNQVMVTTTYKLGEQDAEDAVKAALLAGCEAAVPGSKPTILRTTNVGPTVAEDIKEGARYAVFFSLLGMFLYILLRFRGWQFGLGATVGLTFNVLFVLGLFS